MLTILIQLEVMRNKILLICKESYSFPFYFVAKDLLNNNLKVGSYFFNSIETKYEECLMNTNTYWAHKKIENLVVYDNNKILDSFTKNLTNPPIDFNFLESVQKEYTNDKTLSLQVLTSQFFSSYFHDRFFFEEVTYEQQMYWLELNYKRVLEILDEFKPDAIWDLDNAELSRSIIAEVATVREIPYISIDHSRFEKYKVPTYSTIFRNNYFFEKFSENLKSNKERLETEYSYINHFRSQDKIMSQIFRGDITSDYERPKISYIFKYILSKSIYLFNITFVGKNYKLRRDNKIIFPSNIKFLFFFIVSMLKRWWLLGPNKYFSIPDLEKKYIYMPLHLIPESSTSVLAPFYLNELASIQQVSKALPIGWYLYVKEHQSMLGERPIEFYRQVNKLPNVKMISVNYFRDPKPLILGSMGVITVTGSAAYEAALLGKKALIFGDVSFGVMNGIARVRSFEDLPSKIKMFNEIEEPLDIHSCAAYLATVKSLGTEIDLKYLMRTSENILLGNEETSDTFKDGISSLCDFYFRGMENFKHHNRGSNKHFDLN